MTVDDLFPRECRHCEYFKFVSGEGKGLGECRRSPPLLYLEHDEDEETDVSSTWPPVDQFEWCGEFEMRAEIEIITEEVTPQALPENRKLEDGKKENTETNP
jgi:hypothetical protein